MGKRVFLEVGGFVAALTMLSCAAPTPEQETIDRASLPVVNGVPSHIENVVRVWISLGEFGVAGCTGTVVAPRWVLTAKHCHDAWTDNDGNVLYVPTAHDLEIETPTGVTSAVEMVFDHPEPIIDVALYRLSSHLTLPTASYALYEGAITELNGSTGRVVGYGGTDDQQSVDLEMAQRRSSDSLLDLFPGEFGEDTVPGDSGAPVFMDISGTPTIVAVHTGGDARFGETWGYFTGYYFDWAVDLVRSADEGAELDADLGEPRVAAYSTDWMSINDRATVAWDEAGPDLVYCTRGFNKCASVAHGGTANLGADSHVLSVFGPGQVTLRNRAIVEGDVVTALTPSLQADAEIRGTIYQSHNSWPHPVKVGGLQLGWAPHIEVSKEPRFVEATEGPVALWPGPWGSLTMQPGAIVELEPGTYFFHDLTIEPDARLVVPDTQERTRVYVFGQLNFKGSITGGTTTNTLVGVVHDTYISLEGSMRATLVAPKALVDVKYGQRANIFAHRLELHQGAVLVAETNGMHQNYWSTPLSD